MIDQIQVTPAETTEHLVSIMKAGLVPMLKGSPGLGKSDIIRQIAKKYNLELIDIRLSQLEPTDLNGLINIDRNRNKANYLPFDTFPLKGEKVPEGKVGWILFLDEANSASLAVQAAAFGLTLDRKVGQYELHPKVKIILAGNLDTDKGITNRISTPMQSRLIHLNLKPNLNDWIDWALENDIDHRVISYLRFQPSMLHNFDPNHNDSTFPAPRTWAFMSKLIQGNKSLNGMLPLLAGTVGMGAATQFKGFTDCYADLPSKEDVITRPETAKMKKQGDVMFALSGWLSTFVEKDNLNAIITYIKRMDIEFQVISIKNILAICKELIKEPSINTWVNENYKLML